MHPKVPEKSHDGNHFPKSRLPVIIQQETGEWNEDCCIWRFARGGFKSG
jgi:hypothetical protein